MNWPLVLRLSGFGLFMALATVFIIPSTVEPMVWLPILLTVAGLIARYAPGKYFLHGLATSGMNCVWITSAHFIFYDTYAAGHADEIARSQGLPLSPRLMMLIVGPIVGLISGCILGLFAFIASKLIKPAV